MLGQQEHAVQGNVATLVPTKGDAETAADIRASVTNLLEPVCRALDAARASGFEVSFALAKDGNGRQFISSLVIAKHF